MTLFLLLLSIAAAAGVCFVAGRALLRAAWFQAVPKPIACAALWALASALLLLALLPFAHASDILGAMLLIPVVALLGLAFAGAFAWLVVRRGAAGHWPARAWVGAALGLVLTLACGIAIHVFLDGWGGPGGGSFRRPDVLTASLFFSWLVPLIAVMGVATPLQALRRSARESTA